MYYYYCINDNDIRLCARVICVYRQNSLTIRCVFELIT
jgi:hypothetical protein